MSGITTKQSPFLNHSKASTAFKDQLGTIIRRRSSLIFTRPVSTAILEQRRPHSPHVPPRLSSPFQKFSNGLSARWTGFRSPRSPRSPGPELKGAGMASHAPGSGSPKAVLPAFLQLSEDDIGQKFIDLDFEQRNRVLQGMRSVDPSSRWARLSGDDVSRRNRYMNIDPWANNRIHLKVPAGQCDYINASPIVLKSPKSEANRRYIATQGPKHGSCGHFWQMIWHETGEVAVIVMLTQTHEAGREKCFTYFPLDLENKAMVVGDGLEKDDASEALEGADDLAESSETDDGAKHLEPSGDTDEFSAKVELVDCLFDEQSRSTVRNLLLHHGGDSKKVVHYLFEGWPDFHVPDGQDRLALLELVKKSAASAKDTAKNPRIVHCSAGVGRSGTFVALDYLLGELANGALDHVPDKQDLIFETVNELRKQRMMMVQGESQYDFLYEVLKEQWLERQQGEQSPAAEAQKEHVASKESSGDGSNL